MHTMKAIIQAGGAGTRLKSIIGELPKPMVPVLGKPILERTIESLKASGVTDIMIIRNEKGSAISDYFGNGERFGVNISYFVEDHPLGTGGALKKVAKEEKEDFFLVFGDLLLDVDWERFMRFHKEHAALLTAFAHPNSHPFDSDLLSLSKEERIEAVLSKKEKRDFSYWNLTNAGLYVCSPSLFEQIESSEICDFEKTFLRGAISLSKTYAYESSEYVKDVGTPERYEAATRDLSLGIPAAKNLRNPQKAIFLDRDGTINVFGDFVRKRDQIKLIPTASEGIKLINQSPYLAIVITNQPVIARGETTFEEMDEIHKRLETLLGEQGAYLDGLYFCPHHPHKGFPGEVPELKIDCACRKPKIGMLLKAKERFNIDLSASWFIGDTLRDVQTGINGGCKTALVHSGDPRYDAYFEDAKPTFESKDMLEAVERILGEKQ